MAPAAPLSLVTPTVPVAPTAPITPIAPELEPEPEPIRFQNPPPAPVVQPAAPAETRFLNVVLTDISHEWPEAVQHEIIAHQLSQLHVQLPFGVIELAMKQGKDRPALAHRSLLDQAADPHVQLAE